LSACAAFCDTRSVLFLRKGKTTRQDASVTNEISTRQEKEKETNEDDFALQTTMSSMIEGKRGCSQNNGHVLDLLLYSQTILTWAPHQTASQDCQPLIGFDADDRAACATCRDLCTMRCLRRLKQCTATFVYLDGDVVERGPMNLDRRDVFKRLPRPTASTCFCGAEHASKDQSFTAWLQAVGMADHCGHLFCQQAIIPKRLGLEKGNIVL